MAYFTREMTIPDYGWKVRYYEPSIQELQALEKAYRALDWNEVGRVWAPMISSWDCTDRQEKPLPINPESVAQLPHTVLKALTLGLFGSLTKDAGDPKAGSEPLLTSPPVPEATP